VGHVEGRRHVVAQVAVVGLVRFHVLVQLATGLLGERPAQRRIE
jgi:hypothetical protein